MSRGIKFKVFLGKRGSASLRNPPQHYAHMVAGNGSITWQSEGYDDVRSAFKVCRSTWGNIGKAMGADPKAVNFPPVPYTKDSLRPKPKKVAA